MTAWAQYRRCGEFLLRLGPPPLMSMEGEDINMFRGRPQAVAKDLLFGPDLKGPE